MIGKVSERLRRAATGRVALIAVAVFALFVALVLPGQAAEAERRTGGGESPDTAFLYAPEDLYRMAESYGEAGRAAYIEQRFTFDLVWPLAYAFFLTATIGWVYRRAFAPGSAWQMANLAPALGALLDYMENVSTSLVMARYPEPTPVVAWLAPIFTLTKWVFVGGSFGLLCAGVVAAAWKKIRGR